MNEHAPAGGAVIGLRTALISIVGFWLFYFVIATLRSLVIGFEDQVELLGRRLIVSAGSIGITFLLYLALRRIATLSLRHAVAIAAIASLPAAIGYATITWYAFDGYISRTMPRVIVRKQEEDRTVTISVGGDAAEKELGPMKMVADHSMNGYFFMIAWSALFLALSYAAAVREAERRAAAFRTAAQSAELRALRYQVSPHFLFNTLNSLSSLVLKGNRDEAERMIMNLATFFRTSLTAEPTEDVPLAEEIRLQNLYLDIEMVRFPGRLIVDIAIPDDLRDVCVPGLILQPLVENAIKHGVSCSRRAVTLRIHARRDSHGLLISVEDDADPLPTDEAERVIGTGVGLANVRDRLFARFGDAAFCRWGPLPQGGFAVTLGMPLVHRGC
ncbi:sensor histidine kinase [Sphingomonas oleivorans]|uniref:sensor histidine kinase n=1 Tax=Sphingomonas oleivorans TaxID=1735121 RepID=UPI000E731A90|nr:histidine kinase [Sphingomonas oleivorans]